MDAVAIETKLAVRDLHFFYNYRFDPWRWQWRGFEALKGISLDIPSKKVTGFIGASGCGKSTLLKVFNRMYMASPHQLARGSVLLDGKNILSIRKSELDGLRKRVGMVFQKPTAITTMSIYDNVALPIRMHERLTQGEVRARAEEALMRAGLWTEVKDKLGQNAGLLSGGQQQRLCIARSIAGKPDVLLLDEPCSALDPGSTAVINDLLEHLAKLYTVVMVAHNLAQVRSTCDYVGFMEAGELIEFGTTADIFVRPHDERTENYVTEKFAPIKGA